MRRAPIAIALGLVAGRAHADAPPPSEPPSEPIDAEPWAVEANTGWHFGLIPRIILPTGGNGWGGGLDPEVRWGFRVGGHRELVIAPGLRLSGYDLPKQSELGLAVQATMRFTVPLGRWAPYASVGFGAGWVYTDGMTTPGEAVLGRVGFMYHYSKKLSFGLDAMYQVIDRTNFAVAALAPVMILKL